MLQQVKEGMPRHSGDQSENESRKLFRKRSSEVVFLYYLVHKTNQHITDFVDRERLRTASITAGVHAIMERLCCVITTFELWNSLIDSPYPLDTETAAAVSAVLTNHVTSISDLLDHVTYQLENGELASGPVRERLKRAIYGLCRRGLVKCGSCVRLGSSSMEFLSSPPLVDEKWIDSKAVEFAEYAALLREKKIDLEAADPHMLAPLRPRRRKPKKADVVSETEVDLVRSETAIRLSKFPGRTKKIEGGLYFHLDDYRAWSERKADGDLQIIEGVVTQSWNAWVDANGDEPELIGLPISKLDALVHHVDFFSCDDPERQRRREERVSLMKISMADEKEISQILLFIGECRISIPKLLIEVRSVLTAMEQITSRYFHGLEIIFKSNAAALKELGKGSDFLTDYYHCLVDMIKADESAIVFGARIAEQAEKIDHASESALERRAADLVRMFVDLARAEMLAFFDEIERAKEILKPILKGELGQVE